MRIFEVAAIKEIKDQMYEILFLTDSNQKEFHKETEFIGLSKSAAVVIREFMRTNKPIGIQLNGKTFDDNPGDIQPSDLYILETDKGVGELRHVYTMLVRQLVTHAQANVSGMMMYEYININNILCDKGYFVHDDNREEVYIQILETGDEVLIDQLSTYLNARDYISDSGYLEKNYRDFYKEMNDCETDDELTEKYTSFIDTYLTQVKT